MTNPSNLYAEKIFSEHPIAMWALDDKVDYISLISDNKRKVYLNSPSPDAWQILNGTKQEHLLPMGSPLPETTTTEVYPNEVLGRTGQVTLTSSEIVNPASLSQEALTFSVGAYVYARNSSGLSYEIGYTYNGLSAPVFKKFDSQIKDKWMFISETFQIPETSSPLKIVIRITFLNNGEDLDNQKFYVNGITMGQLSEEFSATSSGIFSSQLPDNLLSTGLAEHQFGVQAASYGLDNSPGYYISSGNNLYAKNSGVPIVYGSSNVTKILPNENMPSLIIPGYGFLNEAGKYRDYTVEMWLRVDSKATVARKIFGPIGSQDGIYVDGPFIKIRIGNKMGAYSISEWFRPMLLDLKVSENSASLLINGEQVISLSYSTNDLNLPGQIGQSFLEAYETQQDWLGFYAYPDVPTLEVDCVAIYTYLVPSIVAKRRFAYGQAVELPENSNSAYGGTSVLIDYSFADYTNNYSYPDIGRWSQGSTENLDFVDDALSVPNYALPKVVFEDGTSTDSWYEELGLDQEATPGSNSEYFLSLLGKQGYLVFESLDFLRQQLKGLYGVFKVLSLPEDEQLLVKIENKNDSSYLAITILENDLFYKFKNSQGEITVYSEKTVLPNSLLSVGLSLDKFSESFGKDILQFLNNTGRLRLYLLGDDSFSKSFAGRLLSFSFCSETDMSKISELFDKDGVLSYFNYQNLFEGYGTAEQLDAGDVFFESTPSYGDELDGGAPVFGERMSFYNFSSFLASYKLIPTGGPVSFSMDIAVSGFWKDYQPLTYFSQYVSDAFGKKYYDLDFIQFNIDYPALENYLNNKFDTSKSLVKTYITFEHLKSSSAAKDSYFTKVPISKDFVVSPGPEWVYTKYEVVDGSVIYPPKNVRVQDLSIVTHIEVEVNGIMSNPLVIKKLQFASQAFNEANSNPIGTRSAVSVFPYTKYGSYFDYKSKNPYRIYKGSSPYLYLTKSSGIEKVGKYDPLTNRGFIVPINESLAETYRLLAIQLFMRYGKEAFPTTPEQIFEIEGKDAYIKFFLVANDKFGKRGRIFAINAKTGNFESGIAFYLNGKVVREPVFSLGDWNALGISFAKVLDFDSFAGGLRVTGSVLVNNISQYQSTNLEEIQRQALKDLFDANSEINNTYEWDFWAQDFNWKGILVLFPKEPFGVNPEDIYKAYSGTNKIVLGDDRAIRVDHYQYLAYQGINWQTSVVKPV